MVRGEKGKQFRLRGIFEAGQREPRSKMQARLNRILTSAPTPIKCKSESIKQLQNRKYLTPLLLTPKEITHLFVDKSRTIYYCLNSIPNVSSSLRGTKNDI